MNEFLSFRKMITPLFIQAIFWIAVLGYVVTGLLMMFQGTSLGFAIGLFMIILGPLAARISCELLIILFRIYDELVALRTGSAPGHAGPGFPVMPPNSVPPPYPPGS